MILFCGLLAVLGGLIVFLTLKAKPAPDAGLNTTKLEATSAAATSEAAILSPLITREAGPVAEIARVRLAAAKNAYDTKTAVFIDVRGQKYYDERHIPGALVLTAPLSQEILDLPRETWIIPYCT